jgi:hypothetical protein
MPQPHVDTHIQAQTHAHTCTLTLSPPNVEPAITVLIKPKPRASTDGTPEHERHAHPSTPNLAGNADDPNLIAYPSPHQMTRPFTSTPIHKPSATLTQQACSTFVVSFLLTRTGDLHAQRTLQTKHREPQQSGSNAQCPQKPLQKQTLPHLDHLPKCRQKQLSNASSKMPMPHVHGLLCIPLPGCKPPLGS